jgi:hypothetical protein
MRSLGVVMLYFGAVGGVTTIGLVDLLQPTTVLQATLAFGALFVSGVGVVVKP